MSLGLGLRDAERGSVSFETKYKSLWNRWFGSRGSMENLDVGDDDGDVILKRDHTFYFKPIVGSRTVLYRIVNQFRKKSKKATKWLLHEEAAAVEDTIVHAQLLVCDDMTETYTIDAGLDRARASHAYNYYVQRQ